MLADMMLMSGGMFTCWCFFSMSTSSFSTFSCFSFIFISSSSLACISSSCLVTCSRGFTYKEKHLVFEGGAVNTSILIVILVVLRGEEQRWTEKVLPW